MWWRGRKADESARYWHDVSVSHAQKAVALEGEAEKNRQQAEAYKRQADALRVQIAKMPKPVIYTKPSVSDATEMLEVRGIKLASGDAPTVAKAFLDADQLPICIERSTKLEELVTMNDGQIRWLTAENTSLSAANAELHHALDASRKETEATASKCNRSKAIWGGGGLLTGLLLVVLL